jgi:hypothetical protein
VVLLGTTWGTCESLMRKHCEPPKFQKSQPFPPPLFLLEFLLCLCSSPFLAQANGRAVEGWWQCCELMKLEAIPTMVAIHDELIIWPFVGANHKFATSLILHVLTWHVQPLTQTFYWFSHHYFIVYTLLIDQ